MPKPAKQKKAPKATKSALLKSKAYRKQTTDPEIRKVTVNLPARLLEGTELGTTELIREALKWYRHKLACEALLALRGKVKFGMTYQELKELRD